MSAPSPYGPQPTRPLPAAPGAVLLRPRVPTGRAVRSTVLWSLGSGALVGLAVALVLFVTGTLVNEFGGYNDHDLSPWWVLFGFVVGTLMATFVASVINLPVLLLMRLNDGFASMSAIVQGLLAWLIGWVPFGLLFLLVGLLGNRN